MVIYAVHLRADGGGSDSIKRAIQISYLTDYISNHSASTSSESFIVLGDFNTQAPTEGAYKNIFVSNGGYFYDPSNPTEKFTGTWDQVEFIPFATWLPTSVNDKYDNILISANVKDNIHGIQYNSGSYTVYGNPGNYGDPATSPDARIASDHLPVYATFNFTDRPNPVEITSFAGVLNKNYVGLNWRTETEVNNFGFSIERSKGNAFWLAIGFVEGYGNSKSPKHYSFRDHDIKLSEKYNYRLKRIDNDGTFEYSDIITVNTSLPYDFFLSQNYPDPFKPETTIKFEIPKSRFTTLKVYNALGKEVTTLVNGEKSPGKYEVKFNADNLPSGIYFFQLKVGSFNEVKKMILLN